MKIQEMERLNSALDRAHQVSKLPSIAQDKAKKQEILGIAQNLEAAIRALDRGTDDEGRPITPAMIGAGLNQMLEHMTHHAIWVRLHMDASDDIRRQLQALEDEIKVASASLDIDDIRDRILVPKKWWQFWKKKRKADFLVLLVEKEPPEGRIKYFSMAWATQVYDEFSITSGSFEQDVKTAPKEEVIVTHMFEEEYFIRAIAKSTANRHGFGDSYKLRWQPYSSVEGIRSTIILIYAD